MSSSSKSINLALQGGGSHGAFTWGVLDRLLEEEGRLHIEGLTGTSAGAMNGAAFVQGYATGGAAGARDLLTKFWEGVGELAVFEPPARTFFDQMMGNWNIDRSAVSWMTEAMEHAFSPYQTNPLNVNPLRQLAERLFDPKIIQTCAALKFFVSATNVETGRVRVFAREEITVDVLMASACLPLAFQAVPIDGVPYWDGGYVGNPSFFPLIYHCASPDIVLIQINPLCRVGTPDTPAEILNRLNEITFNASLIGEMRAIAFVQKLIDQDRLKNEDAVRLKRMNIHMISAEETLRDLGAASKLNVQMDFLLYLKELGRKAAAAWLVQNGDAIGQRSSVDIAKTFL